MIDFIDKTTEQAGTPINRKNLMAMQGIIATETYPPTKNEFGEIQIIQINTETNGKGETLTNVFNNDRSITETFVGEKTITKTTTFNTDGSISEVIS